MQTLIRHTGTIALAGFLSYPASIIVEAVILHPHFKDTAQITLVAVNVLIIAALLGVLLIGALAVFNKACHLFVDSYHTLKGQPANQPSRKHVRKQPQKRQPVKKPAIPKSPKQAKPMLSASDQDVLDGLTTLGYSRAVAKQTLSALPAHVRSHDDSAFKISCALQSLSPI